MPSAQHYKETAFMILDAYRSILNGNANVEEIGMWVDLGNTVLQAAAELLQSKLSVADKQKLQAATAIIKTALQLFREHRVGGRLSVEQASTSHESVKSVTWEDLETAFEGRIRTGVISNTKHLDFKSFIQDAQREFIVQIKKCLEEHVSVKVNSVLAAEYQIIKNSEYIVEVKYFNTKSVPIYTTTDLREWFLVNVQRPIDTDMEEFQEKESGWSLQSILNLTVNINRFNPIRGSSFIKLPYFISKKKACINVKNNDNMCFKWAVLSALHPNSSHPTRITSYSPYENELNFDGMDFPVDVRQVAKFEKKNNISINVYFLKKLGTTYKVLPRHLTAQKHNQHVNLLLVENFYIDEKEEHEHDANEIQEYAWNYVWIKNLSRLLRSQTSSYESKAFICDRCMHVFWTKEKLSAHTNDCEKMNECKIILPSKRDSILQFKNFSFTNRVPYVVYADFECLLRPIDNGTRAYQQHDAFSVGYYVRCSYDDSQSQYNCYRQMSELDETPAKWFVHNLHNLACNLEYMYKNPKPMNSLTLSQTIDYDRARHCHICRKPFSEADTKVRDHCHFTGIFVGSYTGIVLVQQLDREHGWFVNGFWPLQYDRYIAYCVTYDNQKLKYDPDGVTEIVEQKLRTNWPVLVPGETQEKHWEKEYNRYGSCVTTNVTHYFSEALRLFDEKNVGNILSEAEIEPGNSYTLDQIFHSITKVLEKDVYVKCRLDQDTDQQYLAGVTLCLSASHKLADCLLPEVHQNQCDNQKLVNYL